LIYESIGSGLLAPAARREAADKRLSILETDVFARAIAGASRQQILDTLGIQQQHAQEGAALAAAQVRRHPAWSG
jgi:hypothetical protein